MRSESDICVVKVQLRGPIVRGWELAGWIEVVVYKEMIIIEELADYNAE